MSRTNVSKTSDANKWIFVNDTTRRLKVPGGWLYITVVQTAYCRTRNADVDSIPTLWSTPVFVEEPPRRRRGRA